MFARLTVVQASPDRYDDAVKVINEKAVPGIKEIPGVVAAYWAADRSSGKLVTFAVFDTEESLNASEEQVRQLRERSVAAIGGQVLSVENYEVVGQA
jgi:hypothetical protein